MKYIIGIDTGTYESAYCVYSCELLSKWGIFDISNNVWSDVYWSDNVVNCFQNEVSLISVTTTFIQHTCCSMLWIAFKMRYLWYQ